MFENKLDLSAIDESPDLVALHFARELFSLKERMVASGLEPVADQLGVAINMLDDIWMMGREADESAS